MKFLRRYKRIFLAILCLSLFFSTAACPSFAGLLAGADQTASCVCPMMAVADPCLDCADNGEHLIDFYDTDDPFCAPELTAAVSGAPSVTTLRPPDPNSPIPSVYLQILVPPKISV